MKKYILFLLLAGITSADISLNLALRGHATQIDTYNERGAASHAIDGNRDSVYSHNSCSHTSTTTDPWWRVDLMDTYVITAITIVNRGDCCQNRLDGAEIRVGNSLLKDGNDNPIVANVSHIATSQTFPMSKHVEGRYINVFLPGIEKYIHFCEVEVYGYKQRKNSENVALRGHATQIDTYNELGAASNAIDGNRDSIYYSDSCSHTFTTTDPWWRVDLMDTYVITAITIVNRGDCCQNRLDGAEIRVGNSLHNNGNDNPVVTKISHIASSQTFTMSSNVEGRYVNVFLPGTDKYLTLCEVEVYGHKLTKNVALSGDATQIDTYNELGAASNAIDGNRDSSYYSDSCSHTFTTTDPWWRVDLRDIHVITAINIVNRGDCCQERLDGAEIRVGNSLRKNGNDNPIVANISHIASSQLYAMSEHVEGRYVNIILPGTDKYLSLCEVEVHGYKAEVNLALRGRATQIDSYNELAAASNAIDGKREAIYYSNSCTHTFTTTDPWWRVDLLKPYMVTSISVTNRGDCCAVRLDGAQIHAGMSLINNGNNNPVVANISHIAAGKTQTFTLPEQMKSRYVNVFLPGNDKYLTLCEVEVYGHEVVPVNVARFGEATQIDTYNELGAASNAIDGNRDPIYSQSSCSQTSVTTDPWWRVDLRDNYVITSVTVTNRRDCCHEEINGAEIRVGNSLENNGNNNPLMAKIPRIPKGISQSFFSPEPVGGRYVNVFLRGEGKKLTLCEVEVYGYKEEVNVARHGEATQIDKYDELGAASNAIDGNRDAIYSKNSCSQTSVTTDPWWRVDLRDNYVITSVTVTNRRDCCHEEINGAEIRVGNSLENNGNDNSVMAKISRIPQGISQSFFSPEPVEGRYVNVFLRGEGKKLTFCEVEVYGHRKEERVETSPTEDEQP